MLHLALHNELSARVFATTHKHLLLELILRSHFDSRPVVVFGAEDVRSHTRLSLRAVLVIALVPLLVSLIHLFLFLILQVFRAKEESDKQVFPSLLRHSSNVIPLRAQCASEPGDLPVITPIDTLCFLIVSRGMRGVQTTSLIKHFFAPAALIRARLAKTLPIPSLFDFEWI